MKRIFTWLMVILTVISLPIVAVANPIKHEVNNIAISLADKNKAEGEKFLAENKTKPGIVTLADGLQYKIIEAGSGPKPSKDSTVTVDYEGKLINGKVFDSSYSRGQPISFPVSGVIAGWQEALPLMNTGATWMLYIPANLAYGEKGAGNAIGPNETLVFKVHLISVNS